MLKIGHRGAKGYEPENTLTSFRKAMELGVDAIELDVHKCKSGELVVIHDYKVNRTTNGKGLVRDKTLTELKQLNVGDGQKIPTLKEVLDLVDREVIINIELKGKNTPKELSKLLEEYVVNKDWDYNDFLVSSENYESLKKFKECCNNVRIGVIIKAEWWEMPKYYYDCLFRGYSSKIKEGIELARKLDAYSLNLGMTIANKRIINKLKEDNFKLFVWTADRKRDIKKMKRMKVDGIFSNYPDRI